MLTSQKEPKNIPVSNSLLHELEYKNLYLILIKKQEGRRRAFSEKKFIQDDKDYMKKFKKNEY